jgi:hypothetical protein
MVKEDITWKAEDTTSRYADIHSGENVNQEGSHSA